jgi:small GTP-binding protein
MSVEHKIAFLGQDGVGKTSIVYRVVHGGFNSEIMPTIGAAFNNWSTNVDGKEVKLNIMDTAGADTFKCLVPMYIRNSKAVVFVYNVADRDSFLALDNWFNVAYEAAVSTDSCKSFFVANKIDLSSEAAVTESEGLEYAASKGGVYMETSAKTGQGINDLFNSIASEMAKIPQ